MKKSIELLKSLIAVPSPSGEEDLTATLIFDFLEAHGVKVKRKQNNIWAHNKYYKSDLPSILLNSHHDTVKPAEGYSRNPFDPEIEDGKLYGLGSNDAGGALVSLLTAFLHFHEKNDLKYNLIFAATAEEEISGKNGISMILSQLGKINLGIVGEPTKMKMAVAEKGLMVLDCSARGKSGHAARDEGENAIYKAMEDIDWIKNHCFPKVSELLGPVKMSVTQIKAGSQHNITPENCEFVMDIRFNEQYTNKEILETLHKYMKSEIKPRSLRLNSSSISVDHPIVKAGKALGLNCYGSPTLSDQALMDFESIKIGPGDSARSHTADEFIFLDEIEEGINIYKKLLKSFLIKNQKDEQE